jgi:DNA-binding response OmpR family regulator
MAESTVLVVENEAPVRAFLEQQLTDDGFDVLSAARAGSTPTRAACGAS